MFVNKVSPKNKVHILILICKSCKIYLDQLPLKLPFAISPKVPYNYSYTLLILTPPFPGQNVNLRTLIDPYS